MPIYWERTGEEEQILAQDGEEYPVEEEEE